MTCFLILFFFYSMHVFTYLRKDIFYSSILIVVFVCDFFFFYHIFAVSFFLFLDVSIYVMQCHCTVNDFHLHIYYRLGLLVSSLHAFVFHARFHFPRNALTILDFLFHCGSVIITVDAMDARWVLYAFCVQQSWIEVFVLGRQWLSCHFFSQLWVFNDLALQRCHEKSTSIILRDLWFS